MTLRTALVIDGSAEGAKKAAQETAGAIGEVRKAAGDAARDTGAVAGNLEKAGTAAGGLAGKAGDAAGKLGDLGSRAEHAAKKIEPAATTTRDLSNAIGGLSPAGQVAIEKLDAMAGSAGKVESPFRLGLSAITSFVGGLTGGLIGGAIAGVFEGLLTSLGTYALEAVTKTDDIDRALKAHIEIIKSIKGAYAEAEGGASSYGLNSAAVLRFGAQQDESHLQDAYQDALPDGGFFNTGVFATGAGAFSDQQLGPFSESVRKFRKQLSEGRADVIAFRSEISGIAAEQQKDSPFRLMAETILDDTKLAAKAQSELLRSQDILKAVEGDNSAAARALGGATDKFGALGNAAGSAAGRITPTTKAISDSGNAAEKAAGQIQAYNSAAAGAASTTPPISASPARAAATAPAIPFAAGGIVDRPTLFGFGNGQTGLMGEDGAEAIMPLKGGQIGAITASGAEVGLGVTRLADGGLGVELPEAFASGGVFPAAPGRRGGSAGGGELRGLNADINVLRGSLSGFVSGLRQGQTVLQSLGSVVTRVSDRFLDLAFGAIDKAVFGQNGFGSLGTGLGSWLGKTLGMSQASMASSGMISGLFHGGGEIGASPSAMRMVSASVFVDAPRMHRGGVANGLSGGEVPIIAMQGEEIGWPNELARKYGRGGNVTNFYIETPSPKSFAESRATVTRAAARLSSRSGRYV